jgi:hypothetical protein
MTIQRPAKADEIRDAIAVGRPFQGTKINADHIAVLSGPSALTGPLADEVNRSASDYREQYLAGGGRERAAWHVVYYVSIADPAASGSRYVIAYATASGSIRVQAHPALSKALTAAVSEGMRHLRTSRTWEAIATDRGDYPAQPEGQRDGEGMTFTLWGRDARTDVRQTRALAHYADRSAAYEAMREFERGGEPYISPTGYRGTHNHAWITRSAPENAPAIGAPYAEYREQSR